MRLRATAKRRLGVGILLFGLCTIIALLSALGAYVSGLGLDQGPQWRPLWRQEFKDWYVSGLLAIGALWFCGKNRLEPGKTRRWLFAHLATACVFSALYVTITSWWVAGERSVLHPEKILTFSYVLKRMGIHYFVMNLIVYWLVVFGYVGWHYYQRYCEREVQAAELKRELVEAKLNALRMQLNPHFLFNTLHAISALIHEDPEVADRMVARLSELLRLSLDQTRPQEVPLSEELDFLDRYLEIECTRFGDRLKIEKQVEPQIQSAMVPFLLLQPLVENAVRHGIEPREKTGHIAIVARRNNGMLELRVRDDGAGLPLTAGAPARQGVGLSNTQSRLRHLYGERFKFELADLSGGGLEARITIPYSTNATLIETNGRED